MAQQSGGLAELDSTPGEGTIVKVWLPCADGPLPLTRAAAPEDPALPSRGSTILVVDDDQAVREATVEMLRRAGYTVLEDHDAEMALDRLTQGAPVSIVLSDIVMPRMSGLELAKAVRHFRPSLPFVFISGYTDPGIVAAELGPLRLIRKPFRSAELIAQIEAALAEAPAAVGS